MLFRSILTIQQAAVLGNEAAASEYHPLHWGLGYALGGARTLDQQEIRGAAWQGLPGFQSQKLGSRPGAEVQDQIQLAVVAAEVFHGDEGSPLEHVWGAEVAPQVLDIVVSAGGFYPGGGQFLDVGEGGQLRLAAGDDGDICPGQLFQQMCIRDRSRW